MENHILVDTEHFQLTCREYHIVAKVTWGKMVATCTCCNIIKAEIEKLNCIVNSLCLKAENLENSVCSQVEISHSTQTVHTDSVYQGEGAYGCASFPETKPYSDKCISSDEIENVDLHVTKESEVCEMNRPPKEENTLLTIKVEASPKMLCNTEGLVNMRASYKNVSNRAMCGIDKECSRDHVCTVVGGVDSKTPSEDIYSKQTIPTGTAQGGVVSRCGCCENIKVEIAKVLCTDGIENMESKAKDMESNTIMKLTESVIKKSVLSKIKDDTEECLCKTNGQGSNGDFQSSGQIPVENQSELDFNVLEEHVDVSNLDTSAITEKSQSQQTELLRKASQHTLYDQTDLGHIKPGDLNGQQDDIDEDEQYLCEICARRFSTPDGLSMHCVIHIIEISDGEMIGFEESVNEFLNEEQHKLFAYKHCPLVPNMTQNEAKSDACQVGNKEFSGRDLLKTHNRNHPVKTSYKCDVRGKGFVEKRGLAEHKKMNPGQKPYTCTVCGKGFAYKAGLVRHNMIHTGDKPYACKLCKKRFIRSDELAQHKNTHSEERHYKCGHCGQGYKAKSSLITHIMTHTGEKPYKCKECGKGFTTKSGLTIHSSAHTGVKPYECNVCCKVFASKSALSKHNRIHTGDKPHTCQLCGKKFTTKHNLLRHNLTHRGANR